MRISLNLATRPFADFGPIQKKLRIAMGVFLLVSVGLFLLLHAIHQKAEAARANDHSLDGQIAHIAQEREGYQKMMQEPTNAQVLKQSAALNALFEAKAFSWTLAMEDLETVLPGGVQVNTLEPERQKDGRIVVHLRVIGPRNGDVELVRNLEHSRHFVLPRVVQENAESNSGPGQPLAPVSESDRVQFDMLAEYNPAVASRPAPPNKVVTDETESGDAGDDTPAEAKPAPRASRARRPYTGGKPSANPGGQQ